MERGSFGNVRTVPMMHKFYIDSALFLTSQSIKHQSPKREEDSSHPLVLGAITNSVMFLELTINCYYCDQCSPFANTKFGVLLRRVWDEGVDRQGLLSKYQIALALANAPLFDAGSDPFQATSLIIELRNRLTHPKIAFGLHGEDRLEERLRGRFFFREVGLYQSFLPDECFSPECAIWCIRSALDFVNAFLLRLPRTAQKMTTSLLSLGRWNDELQTLSKAAEENRVPYKF